jgi:hypothetical protein
MEHQQTIRRSLSLAVIALATFVGAASAATPHTGAPGSTTPPIRTPVKTQISDYDLAVSSFSWSPQGRAQKFDVCVVNKGRRGVSKAATVRIRFDADNILVRGEIGIIQIAPLSPEETRCSTSSFDFHGIRIVEQLAPNACIRVYAEVANEDYPLEKYKHDNQARVLLKPLQGIGCSF